VIGQLFDVLVSIISEAYFSNEIIHETNELSLRMKGLTQNAAIECERLRSLLLDWLRTVLTYLYQSPEINVSSLPKLRYSNFGLWVIYKADLLYEALNVSPELRKHIQEIDSCLFVAAEHRDDKQMFFRAVTDLNEAVTKASWFLSSIVDRIMELDTGLDALTRLFNRRYLETILRRQTDISIKQGLTYSVLMIDIDHFKEVNDLSGHEGGDSLLKQFSELLLHSVRTSDFVFRYGGEEFLVVLGNVGHEEASSIAEKIRQKCETYVFKVPGDKNLRRTCSIGIATYNGHPDYNRLVKEADKALYEAKQSGRNRVVFRGA
jgi:diguanylate cyclase